MTKIMAAELSVDIENKIESIILNYCRPGKV
jgi:hypothetical protein